MKWILVFWLLSGFGDTSNVVVSFDSKQACINASYAIRDNLEAKGYELDKGEWLALCLPGNHKSR